MDTMTQTFNATADELAPICNFVTEKAQVMCTDNRKIYALCLAIDEIATNIIRYGYGSPGITDDKIDVTIITGENALTVILEDDALPFDPMPHTLSANNDINTPIEGRPTGGLGIMLAQQSVDEFKYEYANHKNRNIFIINL